MLAALLPGVQVTYNGEEIGMEDGEVSFEEGVDIGDCTDESCFKETSRDFERTPYHWDRSKNAGFSNANHTWLPVSSKYCETNLDDELLEGVASHYHVYQDLRWLRQQKEFSQGKLKIKAISDRALAFSRYLVDGDAYVCVLNVGNEAAEIDLVEIFNFGKSVQVLVTSVNTSLDRW